MKKAIIGLSALLITAFVVILAVNAQNNPHENKKSCTEMSKDGSKCTTGSGCCKMKCGNTTEAKACDQANCKEGKCDHESCKTACAAASCEAKKCDQSKTKSGSVN